MKKTTFECPKCGGDHTNVARDAAARWDDELQDWQLVCVHDDATCEKCGYSSHAYKFKKQNVAAELAEALRETINQLDTLCATKGNTWTNERINMVSVACLDGRRALAKVTP